jgi:hypothetical protein
MADSTVFAISYACGESSPGQNAANPEKIPNSFPKFAD